MRTYIKDLKDNIEKEVTVSGWVSIRRDQGKMIFLDLRDASGYVQGVILPMHAEALEVGGRLRTEWCVEVSAKVNKRPERNVKADVVNGELELEILNIKVLNESETPPFDLSTDGKEVNEEVTK